MFLYSFDIHPERQEQQHELETFNLISIGGILVFFCCLGLLALVVQCRELVMTLKQRHDVEDPSSSHDNIQSIEQHIRNHYKKSFEEVSTELQGLRSLQHEVTSQLDDLRAAMHEIQETARVASQLRRQDLGDKNSSTDVAATKKDR